MIGLGSGRGTFTAWEYFFAFEGGAPPWMSGMAQGTGIQALSRAYALTGVTRYSDTGSWSLYSLGGPPSTVEYHTLLRDILSNLCKRIGTDVYCTTADRFTAYLSARSP
jgi:D-glucuronyl C5-epimerase C-terminus